MLSNEGRTPLDFTRSHGKGRTPAEPESVTPHLHSDGSASPCAHPCDGDRAVLVFPLRLVGQAHALMGVRMTHLDDVLMVEVPQQFDLPQCAFGIHHVVKGVCDLLDGNLLVGPSMPGGAVWGRERERGSGESSSASESGPSSRCISALFLQSPTSRLL